jgi:ornithine decarboxylase
MIRFPYALSRSNFLNKNVSKNVLSLTNGLRVLKRFGNFDSMSQVDITDSKAAISNNLMELLELKSSQMSDLESELFERLVSCIEVTNVCDKSEKIDLRDDPSIMHNSNRRDLMDGLLNSKHFKTKHELPIHVVDLGNVVRQTKVWNQTFPSINPYYAVKCNPSEKVLETLFLSGMRTFDCASTEEFDLIQDIGIGNEVSLAYSHCIKPIETLEYINKFNGRKNKLSPIDYTTFDCKEELIKIKEYCPNIPLYLRIRVESEWGKYTFDDKFGCLNNEMLELVKYCLENDLNVCGVMFHVGCAYNNSKIYSHALNKAYKLVLDCENLLNHKLDVIDIGGGFPGVNQHFGHKNPSFGEVSEVINGEVSQFDSDLTFSAEPGRFFVTSSTTAVFNIIGKRKRESKMNYFINDSMYQTFSYMLYESGFADIISFKQILNGLAMDDRQKVLTDIFGRTCDGMDIIYKNILMPDLTLGDTCISEHFGAYGWNTHLPFNGFKNPELVYTLSV